MTQNNNTDESDVVEQFRQMDEDEQAELLRNLDKYPVSISVLEGFQMTTEFYRDKVPWEPFTVNPKDTDSE